MAPWFAAWILVWGVAPDAHLQRNPVYRELVCDGVPVSEDCRLRLPEPTMADGLSAAAVHDALAAIPGRFVPVDQLVRPSPVAPVVYRFRPMDAPGCAAPVYGFDFWMVAYGRLDVLFHDDALGRLFDVQDRRKANFYPVGQDVLHRRQITSAADADPSQGFYHAVVAMLDRVELSVTARTCESRTDDSLVLCAEVDPRFLPDGQFPNRWRPIVRGGDGSLQSGSPAPYPGGAIYLKITRLADPAGALFIECHLVFAEPDEWFGGANLLRSKLPLLIQSNCRDFRRGLARESQWVASGFGG